MTELRYTIQDEAGIHARPAGMFVKTMSAFESDMTIMCGSKSANCKKLFSVMALAVKRGETVHITATGPDETLAIAAAQKFFIENL